MKERKRIQDDFSVAFKGIKYFSEKFIGKIGEETWVEKRNDEEIIILLNGKHYIGRKKEEFLKHMGKKINRNMKDRERNEILLHKNLVALYLKDYREYEKFVKPTDPLILTEDTAELYRFAFFMLIKFGLNQEHFFELGSVSKLIWLLSFASRKDLNEYKSTGKIAGEDINKMSEKGLYKFMFERWSLSYNEVIDIFSKN
jgi:predicted lactoylglutathione lyase